MRLFSFVLWEAPSGARQNPSAPPDAVSRGQQPSAVQATRPEQKKTAHDLSDLFKATNAKPSSPVTNDQPETGENNGL